MASKEKRNEILEELGLSKKDMNRIWDSLKEQSKDVRVLDKSGVSWKNLSGKQIRKLPELEKTLSRYPLAKALVSHDEKGRTEINVEVIMTHHANGVSFEHLNRLRNLANEESENDVVKNEELSFETEWRRKEYVQEQDTEIPLPAGFTEDAMNPPEETEKDIEEEREYPNLKELNLGDIIQCKTKEEAKRFCEYVQNTKGWNVENALRSWDVYKEFTCYKITSFGLYYMDYMDFLYCSEPGAKITNFSELVKNTEKIEEKEI